MDASLIKTIILTVAALIVAIPVLRLMRQGKIAGLSASKDGIKLDMTTLETRSENKYYLDRRINEIDEHLSLEVYRATQNVSKRLTRAVIGNIECPSTMIALIGELKTPFYDSARENNFKEKLAMKNKSMFTASKLNNVKDAFDYAEVALEKAPCSNKGEVKLLPPWETISEEILSCITDWADNIASLVCTACESKIETYKEYKTVFQKSHDEKFLGIIDDCIAKNAGYIRGLKGE